MKTTDIKSIIRMPLLGITFLLISSIGFFSVSGCQPDNNKEVLKAYELRMEGKVDEALAHIDSLLSVDSTNALANFEKYRILWHMVKGGADIPMKIEEIMAFVEKAALYDPDNVIIAYANAEASFLKAYMGVGDDKEAVEEISRNFGRVLELQENHPQAMLYLVEIYSQLPEDIGGDPEKAADYADQLKDINEYYAAKAELMLNEQDELQYWLGYLESHEKTPELLEDIAAAYIYEDDLVNAEKYYKEAIALDAERNYLILNMARYYMYQVMQQLAPADSVLPIAATYINTYLESKPAPNIPMEAYALGMLVKTKMFSGQKEEGTEILEKAKELDPYFSKASGLPGVSEFEPPDSIKPRYSSFFKPF